MVGFRAGKTGFAGARRRISRRSAGFTAVMLMLGGVLLWGCGENPEPAGADRSAEPETFTFFGVGRNTRLNDAVRDRLEEQLGSDAVSGRSVIDLNINYTGFLQEHFPGIAELNRRLNFPPRERVDHDVVKLMYRYAPRKNAPFDYVEVLFTGADKKPLLIRIEIEEDEAAIFETLKSKYGAPAEIDWPRGDGKSSYWEKNGDLLIFSRIPNRYGGFDHHVMIFFTDHIEGMVEREEAEKASMEEAKKKAGKSAF